MSDNKIFIFSGEEDYEKNTAIRTCVEELGIQEIVLINVGHAINKLVSCKDNIITSVEKNKCRFPVIFYGGNDENKKLLVSCCDFGNRKDIGWIANPRDTDRLLEEFEKIRFRIAL